MELRVSTWNCFGMGQGLDAVTHLRAPFGERFRDASVLAACASSDVLCVQELLSREAQRFFDGLAPDRFNGRVRDDNRVRLSGGGSMRGSGLGIGARATLARHALRRFNGARVGWDRLARKGALYAQLVVDEALPIDLVTVHLQAGYDAAAGSVRLAQLAELRQLVDEVGSPERAFLVCGDFNICGLVRSRELPPYRRLAEALEGFVDLGADGDLPTFHPHPDGNALAHAFEPNTVEQRIDYVFFRPARGGVRLRPVGVARFFDRPLDGTTLPDGRPAWASDHYGITATFEVAG